MTTPKEALEVLQSALSHVPTNDQITQAYLDGPGQAAINIAKAAIPVAELHENTLERIRDHSVGTTEDGPCIECEHMIADAREALK